MARLVELGQDPQLGARALKRVIEREVAQPIAQKLAVLPPGTPTIASFGREADHLVLHLQELRPVTRSVFWPEAVARLANLSTPDLAKNPSQRTATGLSTRGQPEVFPLSPLSPSEGERAGVRGPHGHTPKMRPNTPDPAKNPCHRIAEARPTIPPLLGERAGVRASLSANDFSPLTECARSALDRIAAMIEVHAPAGRIEVGNLSAESARYFACREQIKKVERLIQAASRPVSRQRPAAAPIPKSKPAKLVLRQFVSGNPRLGRLRDRTAWRVELAEWEAGEMIEIADSSRVALCRELALLEAMVAKPWDDRPAVLVFQPLDERDSDAAFGLAQQYFDFFNYIWGCSAAFVFEQLKKEERLLRRIFGELRSGPIQALFLNGINIRFLIPSGSATMLVRRADGTLGVLMMHLRDAASAAEAKTVALGCLQKGKQPHNSEGPIEGPVLQMITEGKTIMDFRTGLVISAEPPPEDFRALLLSALPLPAEITLT